MAYARGRRSSAGTDFWPGYVDILSTLLLVVTFLLSIFMLAQYFITQEASGKDNAMRALNRRIAQLTELLALEQGKKKDIDSDMSAMRASLESSNTEKARLQSLLAVGNEKTADVEGQLKAAASALDEKTEIADEALAQIELLNQQLLALRRQMAALEAALEASEKRDAESQTRITDLGQRLNVALARKVQELSQYRSEFFGKLRQLLSGRDDIRVVGDRFVFQSEVLFPSGSDQINPEGLAAMAQVGAAIRDLAAQIPDNIPWVLRVDGHTDNRPINSPQFPSNWELSTGRAISVVKFLVTQGVPANNLVAAGFGEFQPLDNANSEEGLRRNRRIELKLDSP